MSRASAAFYCVADARLAPGLPFEDLSLTDGGSACDYPEGVLPDAARRRPVLEPR